MNRTKLFIINIIIAVLLQIVTLLSGFIIPRIMVSTYGSEINGLVTSITQFMTYFSLIEVGLAGAAVTSLFKPLADKNEKEINSIIVASRNFYYRIGVCFVGLVLVFSIIYPFCININGLSRLEVGLLAITLGTSGTIEFFSIIKYRVLLTADQKIYVISFSSILYIILNTFLIYVLAKSGLNVVIVRFIAIASILLRSSILFTYCKRKYKFIDYNEKPNYKALNKKWDVLFIQIADAVQKGAPIIIATFLCALNEVSVFSTYILVIVGINSILSIFSTSLFSPFGDLLARGKQEEFYHSFSIFETFFYIITMVIYIVAFFSINSFISVYMKNADISYQLGWVGFLFIINGLFYNLKTPYQTMIYATGKFKEIRTPLIIQIAIAVGIGFLFGCFFGIIGILISMILSNIVYDIYILFLLPKKIFTKDIFMTSIKRSIICFICCFLSSFLFIFYKENLSTYLDWIKYAFILTVLVSLITIIMFTIFDFSSVKNGFSKIARTLFNKKKSKKEE